MRTVLAIAGLLLAVPTGGPPAQDAASGGGGGDVTQEELDDVYDELLGYSNTATTAIAALDDALGFVYADGRSSAWKRPVRAATTANITLSGTQTIDDVSVVADDRVLVKNQSTGSQNGIYDASAGAWTRVADMDASADLHDGAAVFVGEGTTNAGTLWQLTTNAAMTLGTTALVFAQVDHTAITASTGLTRTANALSVNSSQSIATLSNLTSNGFVKTGSGNGTLSVDTNTYLTGNQTVTLSSDVTGSGATSITATIANDAVTNAKAANMAVNTVKCRITGSTGDPEDCTAANVRTIITAVSGSATAYLDGTGSFSVPAGGGGALWSKHFAADMFLPVDSGWTSASAHTATPATLELANLVNFRAFDQTTTEGVGLEIVIPDTGATIDVIADVAAATSGFTTSNGVQLTLCCRTKYGTGSFTCVDGAAITMTDNATKQRKTQSWAISGFSLADEDVYICELARDVADADDTLTRDLRLLDLYVSVND